MSTTESMDAEARRLFRELFGISEQKLIAQGIDVGEFIQKNLIKALNRRKWLVPGYINENIHYFHIRQQWMLRGYYVLFSGMGLLILGAAIHPLKVLGFAVAALTYPGLIFVIYQAVHSNRAYKEACKRDGVEPVRIGGLQNMNDLKSQMAANARVRLTTSSSHTIQNESARSITQQQTNAAWHPDPSGRFHQRYFDGTTWTSWVINADGAEVIDPQGAPGNTSNL